MSERTVVQSMPHRPVLWIRPGESVHEAACVMTRARCGSVLVMQPGRLLGILTERDLMTRVLARARDPASTRVEEVMTHNPICIAPELPVSQAVLIMLERGFRHLPVLRESQILGVFTARDALPRELGTALGIAEFNEQINDALA